MKCIVFCVCACVLIYMEQLADWSVRSPCDRTRRPGLTHRPQVRTYVEADVIIGHLLPCIGVELPV